MVSKIAVPSSKEASAPWKKQPARVVVLDRIKNLKKVPARGGYPTILYVSDAKAELANCNLSLIKECTEDNIRRSLDYALQNIIEGGWKLIQEEPTTMDYVNAVTDHTLLNFMQTALYKINPYDLRKEVHNQMVSYFNGERSLKALRIKLQSSHKLESLLKLFQNPGAVDLRNAVLEYKKGSSIEAVSTIYNVPTFDIMYMVKSGEAAKNPKKSKAGRPRKVKSQD